jgi:hypothetical protein
MVVDSRDRRDLNCGSCKEGQQVNTTEIERAFKESVCAEVELASAGLDRYIVHVPFTFDDGDHYVVLLKHENGQWVLSDEGHTFMHVSYEVQEFDRGSRRATIDRVLAANGVEDAQGELRLQVPRQRYGDALFSYLQAITRITDVSFLTRERVRTTFLEDFRVLVQQAAPNRNVKFDYAHPAHDPEGRYKVDAFINGAVGRQVLAFAISNDDQCRDATITLYRWESWGEKFHPIAVFRDQTEINRVVLARFSDVAERQFSTLDTARERLPNYLADLLKL